jgi:ectoine hydroxylase
MTREIATLSKHGFLFLEQVFSREEAGILIAELPRVFAIDSPARTFEKGDSAVRKYFGVHLVSELYAMLSRSPRVLDVVEAILDNPVYLYQSKINAKPAFIGSKYGWHQDFLFWHKRDGLPQNAALSVIVFLDDVTEVNAPIMLLEGSHTQPLFEDGISNATMSQLAERHSFIVPKGPAGSVLLFGGLLVHGSGVNLSPFDRRAVHFTYSADNNRIPASHPRSAGYIVSNDGPVIRPKPGDRF